MPSRHEEHSDEVAGDSAEGEPSRTHTHAYAELHPRELQQQNNNTEDLDIVLNLSTYGNAIVNTLLAGRGAGRPSSLNPLCIAPLFDRRVKMQNELVGVALGSLRVSSCAWRMVVWFVFTLSA